MRGAGALLLLGGAVLFLQRGLVGPLGDLLGRVLFLATPTSAEGPAPGDRRPPVDEPATDPLRRDPERAPPPARRSADGRSSERSPESHSPAAPRSSSAKGGPADAGSGAARRAIRISAATAEHALARGLGRSGGTTVSDPEGRPYGVRLHGVSRFRAGLRDGDVVTHLAGRRVHDADEATAAATAVLGGGGRVLTGTLERDGEPIDVVLEIPEGAAAASPSASAPR